MTRRAPAARGKADANQKPIAQAISLLGYPVMELNTAGNGVEDLLVGIKRSRLEPCGDYGYTNVIHSAWLLVECKRPRNQRGEATASQYTKAQKEWREKTQGWPRITVTSAQDAVDQIRRMTG